MVTGCCGLQTDDDGWLWTMGCWAPRGFGGRAVLGLVPARAARAAAPHAHGFACPIPRRSMSRTHVWFPFLCWGVICVLCFAMYFLLCK